jgi:hypothetical protein
MLYKTKTKYTRRFSMKSSTIYKMMLTGIFSKEIQKSLQPISARPKIDLSKFSAF